MHTRRHSSRQRPGRRPAGRSCGLGRRSAPSPRRPCGRSAPRPTTAPRRPRPGRTSSGRRSRSATRRDLQGPAESAPPPGRVSIPHSSTHSSMAMPQTVQTVAIDRSGSFMATRPAKPITKNSPIRVEAQSVRIAAQPLPRSSRASPTVITEPVTSTPAPAYSPSSSARVIAASRASSQPRLDLDPVVAEDLDGDRGQLVGVHRAVAGVLGDHDLGEDRLEGLQQPAYVLVAARPDHADQPAEAERLGDRLGGGARARRVVRGVQHDGRAAPHDLQPARARSPRRTPRGRCRCRACAGVLRRRRRRTPRRRRAPPPRCAPGGRRAAGGRPPSYSPPRPRSVSSCPPTAISPGDDPELHALAGDRGVHLDGLLQQHLGGVDRLLGEDDGGVLLDDPGLLDGDLAGRAAEPVGVVQRDGGDHRDRARRSRWWRPRCRPCRPRRPRRRPGASAKAAYAMPVSTSKKDSRCSCCASTISMYGLMSWYVSMNRSAEIGAPSRLIRSVIDWTCGAGVAAGAQLEGAQQRLDHAGGARSCRSCR